MIKAANTILYCSKWDETVLFYRDQLKLSVSFSTDWFVEFSLNTPGAPGFSFSLTRKDTGSSSGSRLPGKHRVPSFAFELSSVCWNNTSSKL